MRTQVVLAGGGHAHLFVVSRAEAFRRAGADLTLIDPGMLWYSGMATGMLSGMYTPGEDSINLGALCRHYGVTFRRTRAVSLDRQARELHTDRGETVPYDFLSLNVGSAVDTSDVQDPHGLAWTVKPIAGLVELRKALRKYADHGRACSIGVVGGGPTGAEIAANIDALCGKHRGRTAITIAHSGDRLVPGFPKRAADTLRQLLHERGIGVRFGTRITKLKRSEDGIVAETADGLDLRFDEIVFATGLVPSPTVSALGLGDRGLRVDARLAWLEDNRIFGAGDCISFGPCELPKVGVYGVREAPVLKSNLIASVTGEKLKEYKPQKTFLIILNMGDGTGLALRGSKHWHGKLAFKLKHFVDMRFMKQYQK